MNTSVPKINNQYVCIVSRNLPELAAVISSYFQLENTYFPVFECPILTASALDEDNELDEHIISRIRGEEFNTLVHNAILRLGGCENIFLAGLSDIQKTYLELLKHYKFIEVENLNVAEMLLPQFSALKEADVLTCLPEQYAKGLIQARKIGAALRLRDDADPIENMPDGKDGLIVIEVNQSVGAIIGINYAFSINADVKLVPALEENEPELIRDAIEYWQNGDQTGYDQIEAKVINRIGEVVWDKYEYATFFTEGLPYSLPLKNCIPFSYVNLNLRSDIFIINNILFNDGANFDSAVVFSPQFFDDEETESVIEKLEHNHYFVKKLLHKEASVRNLDYHIKEYPHNILHLCSHGGEVDGYNVVEKFEDRHGHKHVMVYNEVVGFAPEPGTDMVSVTSKQIFKELDGMIWRSPELKAIYGQDVFIDMQLTLKKNEKERSIVRTHIDQVPSSCAIKCYKSVHQGMFQVLAAHTSPLIFNNSCWSWFQIAESFLYGGARTYVGTLWAIDNDVAANTARSFYERIFDVPTLTAFHNAIKYGKGTRSADIYIFWGLHFSTMKKGTSIEDSRKKTFRAILQSAYIRRDQASNTKSDKTRRLASEYAKWNEDEFRINAKIDDVKDILKELFEKVPQAKQDFMKRVSDLLIQKKNM